MNGRPIFIPRPGERKGGPGQPRLNRDRKRDLRIWWREIDRVLLGLVLALMAAGTLAVAAASPASAHRLSTDETTLPALYFFWAHIRWQMVGLIVLLLTSMVASRELRRGAILLGAAMLVGLLLVPLVGSEINGARRWLNLGFSLQPSEFLKPAFALILAWVLSWKMRDQNLPVVGITAAFVGLICVLLMMQPDLGSAILFAGCWGVMVVVAGLPLQRLGYLSGAGVALLVLAYLFYDNARNRIDTFLGGPTAYDHVDLASRTLGGGGWFGSGFWLGREKMRLPEAHTDYIFSVIGEEFGLIACGVIVILYLAIVLRVLVRLVEEDRLYMILAASGLTALIGGQAFINILVNLQLFPSKGMTLPLVSYGGSSTIAVCLTVGMLLAVTRRNPYLEREPFDFAAGFEKEDAS
ncbi:cell division protein FtsW [Erythrobacter arachoides]|uniref:Probable peptidoglycan glycosyltransferase FtsW n=1 Tax=Aurantiacibacter arachoides TaxID=1850444 RepID=A0A844ZX64_9SPHN|nr:FtsW/RodA/SpoVE family cell cycle protein [Aurantiacibacter arachoides]MXO92485.1 cell division protein FtsW [Aurantiacibacter arachoides]GGD56800.1 cell division protein FtsW [Aurantiacibacter arachoides]